LQGTELSSGRTLERYRKKVYIRWKWTLKRFTLPISTLDTKVLSGIWTRGNRAILSVDNLETSGTRYYYLLSGKSCFSKSQEDLCMLLGF
jgi:hypothetical protein